VYITKPFNSRVGNLPRAEIKLTLLGISMEGSCYSSYCKLDAETWSTIVRLHDMENAGHKHSSWNM